MSAAGGTMPPMLVSDAERDRAVHVLREAAVSGRLTDESFLRRVDEALRTRTRSELSEVAYWLGRAPGSDLLLTHPSVSRGHARLHFEPEGRVLTDLHSSNGTRVNGWAVVRPVVIKPGDQVSFGSQTFVVTG